MWENIKKAAKFVWGKVGSFVIGLGRALGLVPPQNVVVRVIRALDTDTENHRLISVDNQGVVYKEIRTYLLPLDVRNKTTASKYSHRLFHNNNMVTALLSYVAKGNQEKAKQMPRLELLFGKADVTDYSGRQFKGITPYQYALWALDGHMVRMIEEKARNATGPEGVTLRAELLRQREELKNKGLNYELNGQPYCDSAYDPEDLYAAYQHFNNNYNAWADAGQWDAIDKAWYAVGAQQRLMPAHAIQEMCAPQRSFYPTPTFKERALQRTFDIFNCTTGHDEAVFPLRTGGLGFDFAILRGGAWGGCDAVRKPRVRRTSAGRDLAALKALFNVRTDELSQKPNLTPGRPEADSERPLWLPGSLGQ